MHSVHFCKHKCEKDKFQLPQTKGKQGAVRDESSSSLNPLLPHLNELFSFVLFLCALRISGLEGKTVN